MKMNLKKAVLPFSILLLIAHSVCAQSDIQWQKALGGTADDMVLSIRQTADEGFIVGGVTASKDGDVSNSKGKGDLWVVKLNRSGTISWKKTLGGSNEEQGCIVLPTSDGGYLVAGNTSSNSGDVSGYHGGTSDIWGSGGYDIWIVKLNGTGGIQWQRCLGGSKVDEVVAVKEVPNGFLIAGNTNSTNGDVQGQHGDFDIWIVNLSNNGSIAWQRTLGGPGTEKIRDLQISNGEYLFAGYTTAPGGDVSGHHGSTDIWVGRLNSNGGLLWQRSLGGSRSESDFSNYIRATLDGGVLIAGSTYSNDGDIGNTSNVHSGWVVKLNNQNTIEWQTALPESDGIYGLYITNNGSIVFGTTFYITIGDQKIGKHQVLKLGAAGSIVWTKETHSIPLIIDTAANGGYVLFGHTTISNVTGYHKGYDAWVRKLDADGNAAWEKAYGGSNNDFLQGRTAVYSGNTFPIHTSANAPWNSYIPAITANDGGYYFAVSTGSPDGDITGFHYNSKVGYRFDMWVVKLSSVAVLRTSSLTTLTLKENTQPIFRCVAFPNPAQNTVTILFDVGKKGEVVVDIYAVNGMKIRTEKISQVSIGKTYNVRFNLSNVPSGSYSYKITNGNFIKTGSFLKTN